MLYHQAFGYVCESHILSSSTSSQSGRHLSCTCYIPLKSVQFSPSSDLNHWHLSLDSSWLPTNMSPVTRCCEFYFSILYREAKVIWLKFKSDPIIFLRLMQWSPVNSKIWNSWFHFCGIRYFQLFSIISRNFWYKPFLLH